MKDYLGQELRMGDRIAAVVSHGKNAGASLSDGFISRMTEKTVFFEGPDYTGRYVRERRISPAKVIKIEELVK